MLIYKYGSYWQKYDRRKVRTRINGFNSNFLFPIIRWWPEWIYHQWSSTVMWENIAATLFTLDLILELWRKPVVFIVFCNILHSADRTLLVISEMRYVVTWKKRRKPYICTRTAYWCKYGWERSYQRFQGTQKQFWQLRSVSYNFAILLSRSDINFWLFHYGPLLQPRIFWWFASTLRVDLKNLVLRSGSPVSVAALWWVKNMLASGFRFESLLRVSVCSEKGETTGF